MLCKRPDAPTISERASGPIRVIRVADAVQATRLYRYRPCVGPRPRRRTRRPPTPLRVTWKLVKSLCGTGEKLETGQKLQRKPRKRTAICIAQLRLARLRLARLRLARLRLAQLRLAQLRLAQLRLAIASRAIRAREASSPPSSALAGAAWSAPAARAPGAVGPESRRGGCVPGRRAGLKLTAGLLANGRHSSRPRKSSQRQNILSERQVDLPAQGPGAVTISGFVHRCAALDGLGHLYQTKATLVNKRKNSKQKGHM